MLTVGVDTGGTFTDFVVIDGDALQVHKELSTPDAPERAILQGLAALGLGDGRKARLVLGSTVATNAVLERKGARTAFVTNRGFADLLTIGRQARPELYNLMPIPVPPPVPHELCLETGGRLGADGSVVDPITAADCEALANAVERLHPEAIAVTLLFSFLDDRFEQAIARALADRFGDALFISLSSEVLPEYREYERGITTWLNAYVGPLMQRHLQRLRAALGARWSLGVMQSAGITCDAEFAGRRAVNLLLSGPAGGLQGAKTIAALANRDRLISFDMGGTSTDVALIDRELGLTNEGIVGRYPVGVLMVDMHTIGAGGGSIASVDAGGLLHIGPESAGADPGPACYGRGGSAPTVTDAHLVVGHLPSDTRLGGHLALDREAAYAVLAVLGDKLGGRSAEQAATGVIRVATEHMHHALRYISVERGHDPRAFSLVCFGGAGGLHVCALAESLNMRSAFVPVHAGVLSALGLLAAPPGRQLSRTLRRPLRDCDESVLATAIAELEATGRAQLRAEGVATAACRYLRSFDLCYQGQAYTLNIPWGPLPRAERMFHEQHEQRYGHRLETPVELVNIRVGMTLPAPALPLPPDRGVSGRPEGARPVHGIDEPVPLWSRLRMPVDDALAGPLIIADPEATTFVAPNWTARRDRYGNIALDYLLRA